MNWYRTMKEAEKTAGMWDALKGKLTNPGQQTRIVPLDSAKPTGYQQQQGDVDFDYSEKEQMLKQQLNDVQMEINQLKMLLRSDPTKKQLLDVAIQKQKAVLDELGRAREQLYSAR